MLCLHGEHRVVATVTVTTHKIQLKYKPILIDFFIEQNILMALLI